MRPATLFTLLGEFTVFLDFVTTATASFQSRRDQATQNFSFIRSNCFFLSSSDGEELLLLLLFFSLFISSLILKALCVNR